jgi:hypothetical protein
MLMHLGEHLLRDEHLRQWEWPDVTRAAILTGAKAKSPHLLPIHEVGFFLTEGSFGSILFWEEAMGHLTLREALASHQLDAFVRQQQDDGAELVTGSELERGLALLVTQRRIRVAKRGLAIKQYDLATERSHQC